MKLGVVFPYHVSFSSKLGGPVARWCHEVITHSSVAASTKFFVSKNRSEELFDPGPSTIISVPTLANYIRSISPNLSLTERVASRIWCGNLIPHLKDRSAIIIENRLYYAIILRKLGYKGKIYVHLHNELFMNTDPAYLDNLNDVVDGMFACSRAILSPLKEKHPSLYEKGIVIHNGMDIGLFTPRPDLKKEDVLLFVGRIVPQKGVHLLLEVYEKLLGIYPNLQLKLAGSSAFGGQHKLTTYEKRLKNRSDSLNQNGANISNLGYLDHDTKLPELYAKATVVCMTSLKTEALPMVLIEAMLCGTVVVAPRIGGIPEALPSDDLLYEEGNVDGMVQKILLILEQKEYRKNVERQNLNFARKIYSWDAIRNRFEEILQVWRASS